MKAAIYDYAKPVTGDSAIALVGASDGMAKFVSGGQSLGPMMNLRLTQPETLVDLRGIATLRECGNEGNRTLIGACVTHAEIEDRKIDDGTQGLMPYVARGIAYRAVRNRGTLGGSLAHADPAADWINTMYALDAEFLVAGPHGTRSLTAAGWMSGAFTTALEADEILTVFIDDAPAGVCRAVIGAIDGPPHLIENARALLDNSNAALLDPHLDAAGLETGSYEYQVHRVALERAAAIVRENRKQQ
jgi:carbon-monoxide dehydrogenase medium subunit